MKTQLYDYHDKHAKMLDFSGFKMPLWYKGIIEESSAVRNSAGIFDVSHMGRAVLKGEEAGDLLDYLTPNNVSKLKPGEAHYSAMCNEKGRIIDDIVLLRLEKNRFLLVFNATNREKDLKWINTHQKEFKVEVDHVSNNIAMIAIQGPKARDIIQRACKKGDSSIGRFKCGYLTLKDIECIASGTGYTGEDGLEIFVPKATVSEPYNALEVWNTLLAAGKEDGLRPCGLGARDALRLEAGMCLYGNDINDSTTPFEAKLGFIVKLNKEKNFIGKEALFTQKQTGVTQIRVGIKLLEPGIPRKGNEIIHNRTIVGKVTSGIYSPTLKKGIAMGYVPRDLNEPGVKVMVKIRGQNLRGEISPFPFYNSNMYGWKRLINHK